MDPVVREPAWLLFLSSCSELKKMHGLFPSQIIQKLYGYRGSLQPSSFEVLHNQRYSLWGCWEAVLERVVRPSKQSEPMSE